jgi:hypothetical protein
MEFSVSIAVNHVHPNRTRGTSSRRTGWRDFDWLTWIRTEAANGWCNWGQRGRPWSRTRMGKSLTDCSHTRGPYGRFTRRAMGSVTRFKSEI